MIPHRKEPLVQTIIEKHRAKLAALCRGFQVRKLDLFGSAARDDFDAARSDFDFLVEFEPDAPGPALDRYFGFKEALEALLGRPVDLVSNGTVRNPYLRRSIERDQTPLYPA
jgi:uncharacterized protein